MKNNKNNQLSEIFDNRASNPIHVNNLKFEGFQIDQPSNEEMDFGVEEEVKVNQDISKITSISNNLFHLKSENRKSELHAIPLDQSAEEDKTPEIRG